MLVVLVFLIMTTSSLYETLEDHLLPQGHFLLQNHCCRAKCHELRMHKADLYHWWNWDHHHMLQNVYMCEEHQHIRHYLCCKKITGHVNSCTWSFGACFTVNSVSNITLIIFIRFNFSESQVNVFLFNVMFTFVDW